MTQCLFRRLLKKMIGGRSKTRYLIRSLNLPRFQLLLSSQPNFYTMKLTVLEVCTVCTSNKSIRVLVYLATIPHGKVGRLCIMYRMLHMTTILIPNLRYRG